MVGAEGQVYLHIHYRVAGQNTGLHGSLDTSVNGGDILLGDDAAGNLVQELIALAGLVGSTVMRTWPYWPLPPD